MERSNDAGFDDLFDGPSFKASVRLSQPSRRPQMWPKSASEMRRHTSYGGQGIAALADGDGLHQFVTQRLAAAPPQSKLQLLAHVSSARAQYRPMAKNPGPRKTAIGKSAQPSADRRQWTWRDTSSA